MGSKNKKVPFLITLFTSLLSNKKTKKSIVMNKAKHMMALYIQVSVSYETE